MTMTKSQLRDNNIELDNEYFARRLGDNPNDKVFRQGKWIDISEHNASMPIYNRPPYITKGR